MVTCLMIEMGATTCCAISGSSASCSASCTISSSFSGTFCSTANEQTGDTRSHL